MDNNYKGPSADFNSDLDDIDPALKDPSFWSEEHGVRIVSRKGVFEILSNMIYTLVVKGSNDITILGAFQAAVILGYNMRILDERKIKELN